MKLTSNTFTPAPEGIHPAVCIDFLDLGVMPTRFGDKHRVEFRWALTETNSVGQQYIVIQRYNFADHKKSNLRKMLEAWRGKALTPAELENGFDVEEFAVGRPAMLQIVHTQQADGSIFATVQAVLPLAKSMTAPPIPPTYVRVKDRQPTQA